MLNSLALLGLTGISGFVINGTIRDTDEKAGLPLDDSVDVEITPEQMDKFEAVARSYVNYKG